MSPIADGAHRGRAGALPRCERCGLHLRLCLCAELQPLDVRTRVIVVSTARELPQPTNTGRLVPLAVAGAEVRVHGAGAVIACDPADERAPAVLLFPSADARLLAPDPLGRARTLVVLDGTWRAARRMAARAPELAGLPRVTLPPGPPTAYALRSHPDARALATFEAVARALGVLEGDAVRMHLERVFELFVERTLFSRGRLGGRLPRGIARLGGARSG